MSTYDKASVELGSRVRSLRAARGWNQADLAVHLASAGRAMSQQTIARLESGTRVTGVDDLVALARVFGTSITRLVEPVDLAFGIRPLSVEAVPVLDEATLNLICDQVAARIATAILEETS